jgi:uncharacterized protein YlxW (UPF0749 family)
LPWLFVLILMVVAGLVAAGGDRMGHRAARAKIRIGKLRPRTASTIIAVITGVLISLVTFGVVFAVWADFRNALLSYDEVKGRALRLQAELDETNQKREQAQSEQAKAEATLKQLREQQIETTKSLSTAQQELEALKGKVASSDKELKDLNAKRAKLQTDIDSYRARLDDLRGLVGQARSDVAAYQEGEVVLDKGHYLYYLPVAAGEAGQLGGKLDMAMLRIQEDLQGAGLKLDDASAAAAKAFSAQYPYPAASAVVIISAARNVVAGEAVLLAFDARELKPLINSGTVVMEVLVTSDNARVRMTGAAEKNIAVPAKFDADSLVDFSLALYDSFSASASALGFLPDLRSGDIATPVEKLTTIAGDLVERNRPFIIQFVAQQNLNALDGLGAVDIYISNPAAAP